MQTLSLVREEWLLSPPFSRPYETVHLPTLKTSLQPSALPLLWTAPDHLTICPLNSASRFSIVPPCLQDTPCPHYGLCESYSFPLFPIYVPLLVVRSNQQLCFQHLAGRKYQTHDLPKNIANSPTVREHPFLKTKIGVPGSLSPAEKDFRRGILR